MPASRIAIRVSIPRTVWRFRLTRFWRSRQGAGVRAGSRRSPCGARLRLDDRQPAARRRRLPPSRRRSRSIPIATTPISYYAEFCVTQGISNRRRSSTFARWRFGPDDYQVAALFLVNVFQSLGRPDEAAKYARLGLEAGRGGAPAASGKTPSPRSRAPSRWPPRRARAGQGMAGARAWRSIPTTTSLATMPPAPIRCWARSTDRSTCWRFACGSLETT